MKLARERAREPNVAGRCRAQALSMMRQANSALRLLLRMQEARGKLEADHAACDRAAWTEHRAIALMAEALSPRPEAQPNGEPAPEIPPVSTPRPEPAPLSAAEHYANLYPERAALIRRMGRLPDDVSFAPPDESLVQALLAADTPALAACDALVSAYDPPSR